MRDEKPSQKIKQKSTLVPIIPGENKMIFLQGSDNPIIWPALTLLSVSTLKKNTAIFSDLGFVDFYKMQK